MSQIAHSVAVLTLLGMTVSVGCDSGLNAGMSDRDRSHMKVVGMLYGRCMEANRGAAPATEDQFIAFLQRAPENWNKLAPTPLELLKSGRDGQPLVVLYGPAVKDPPEGGFPWVAHEKTGVDGKQMAVNASGNVELKDPQEIAQLFPSSS